MNKGVKMDLVGAYKVIDGKLVPDMDDEAMRKRVEAESIKEFKPREKTKSKFKKPIANLEGENKNATQ